MSCLFRSLLLLILALGGRAQTPQSRIELHSGKTIIGSILRADADGVSVMVEAGELRIPAARIASVGLVEPDPAPPSSTETEPKPESAPEAPDADAPATAPADPSHEPEVGEPGWKFADAAPAGETAAVTASPPAGSSVAPATASDSLQPQDPDMMIAGLLERYLWIIPSSPGHRASLGAAILFLLVLVVHLSARMANLEGASLLRSGAVAVVAFMAFAVQLSFSPFGTGILVAVIVADILLWFGVVHAAFRAGFYGTTVMLLSFLLSCLVGVLGLEVMGLVLHGEVLA